MLQRSLRAAQMAHDFDTEYVEPAQFLEEATVHFCRTHALPVAHIDFHRVVVDPARGCRIAAAYLDAPWLDTDALASYRALRDETMIQFDYLTAPTFVGGLGVYVEPVAQDPYPDAAAMVSDIQQNRRLKVYASNASENPHPVLTDDENTMFRAVHDAFGHAAAGRGFDRHGEEAAWLKHSMMYSPSARGALTTETRGQNSAMVFGYTGRRFPEQKAVILPAEFADIRNITLLPR